MNAGAKMSLSVKLLDVELFIECWKLSLVVIEFLIIRIMILFTGKPKAYRFCVFFMPARDLPSIPV